jgi:hypothetical protein
MKRMRIVIGALAVAAVMAGVMPLGMTRVEASGGKKGGGDPQAAVCAYLLSVINYPYVNDYIKQLAISVYNASGCQPALQ